MTSRFVKQSLVAASIVTIGTTILSRVFGYLREAVIAGHFGTSAELDVFILAFTVPEFITFITFAALFTALIPSLRKFKESDRQSQSEVFWGGAVSFTIIFGLLWLAIYLMRGQILNWLAPTLQPEQHRAGTELLTIVAPFVFFRGLEAYFRSWLFEKKHFIVPATSTIIVNLIILAAIFLLYDKMEIRSLAYGWLAASIVLAFYNALFAFLLVKPAPPGKLNWKATGSILRLTLAIGVVECIALIYPVVDRYFAVLYLGEGQVAALRYATFLIHIPTGMFVVSFTMASFPWISDLSVPSELRKLQDLYRDSVRLIVFVMSLVAVGLVIFPTEVVRLSFQRGAFDATSLVITASPFMYFALGIVFYSIYVFQIKFYYARMTLARLGVILVGMLAVKIILSYVLVKPMEQDGLALATAVTWLCGCIIMTADLGGKLKMTPSALFMPSALKVLISLVVVGAFWMWFRYAWPAPLDEPLLSLFGRLAVYATSGIALYLILARLLRLPELERMFASIKQRLVPDRNQENDK